MITPLRRMWRNAVVLVGLLLILVGLIGALLPTHLLGVLLLVGLILVLRNSIRWRRRFIVAQRRFPRYGYPVRRLLKGEVWPVIWHELLRTERVAGRAAMWVERRASGSQRLAVGRDPGRWHVLRRIRATLRRRRRQPPGGSA